MAYCGSVSTIGNSGAIQFQPLATTPTDLGTCQYVLMPGTEYTSALQLATLTGSTGTGTTAPQEPFDYQLAGQFWAFGFTVLISLYLLSHVIGLVLKMVRDN